MNVVREWNSTATVVRLSHCTSTSLNRLNKQHLKCQIEKQRRRQLRLAHCIKWRVRRLENGESSGLCGGHLTGSYGSCEGLVFMPNYEGHRNSKPVVTRVSSTACRASPWLSSTASSTKRLVIMYTHTDARTPTRTHALTHTHARTHARAGARKPARSHTHTRPNAHIFIIICHNRNKNVCMDVCRTCLSYVTSRGFFRLLIEIYLLPRP